MMIATRETIPVYRLYGENIAMNGNAEQEPEFFHLESIPSRSRLHDMYIQPHRHANLFQLLFTTNGEARIEFDDRQFSVGPQSLLTIPPGTVHGFRFSQDIDGWVISLTDDHLREILALVPRLNSCLDKPLYVPPVQLALYQTDQPSGHSLPLPAHQAAHTKTDFLIRQLVQEYYGHAIGRLFALRNIIGLLLLEAGRHGELHRDGRLSRQEQKNAKFRKFQTLIETDYRQHLPLARYAREIGVTTTQLNRICKDIVEQTAIEVLHNRLVLEAKRILIYTDINIQQIADELGYQDAGYFSRFFTKKAGMSPARYRALYR
ncbi:helix-turn-helix domain-containing protein [Thalassospira sp. TSL5-1]|uniref:helix-turn-helix domain-containing protein n=1 Tax=Thalassospira sp. TSL5-1 TaxID=1544451 RepID=UPI00093BAFEA|nr:helix-turn-helix domain-containing protein [Thalassospira sp. TSL5-1]OKH90197.1 transcriptional regulator [Thalassospira sp. TSL5-1]